MSLSSLAVRFDKAHTYRFWLLSVLIWLVPYHFGLLSDLTFFHEFKNTLSDLIIYYLIACEHEKDLQKFEELALDFYHHTEPDGFDALYELARKYGLETEKGKIIRKIIQEIGSEPGSIDF